MRIFYSQSNTDSACSTTSSCILKAAALKTLKDSATRTRSEELDENRLSGSFGVPIVWGELDGSGKAEQGKENSGNLHGLFNGES